MTTTRRSLSIAASSPPLLCGSGSTITRVSEHAVIKIHPKHEGEAVLPQTTRANHFHALALGSDSVLVHKRSRHAWAAVARVAPRRTAKAFEKVGGGEGVARTAAPTIAGSEVTQ